MHKSFLSPNRKQQKMFRFSHDYIITISIKIEAFSNFLNYLTKCNHERNFFI